MPRKKSKEKKKTLIPAQLSWDIFDEEQMVGGLKNSWKDKVRLVLHQIPVKRQRAKDKEKAEPYFKIGWTTLNYNFLKSLSNDSGKVLRILEQYGVIEAQRNENGNKSYQADEFSSKYRINPDLIFPAHITEGTKFFRKEDITNASILKAIKINVKKKKKVLTVNKQVYDILKDYTQTLKMDEEKASLILFQIYSKGKYKDRKVDAQWYMDKMISVEGFDELDHYIECPYNRHHHKFSTTMKPLRAASYFEGYYGVKHTQSDIKNCQPYLLSALFHKPFRDNLKDQIHPDILNVYETTTISYNIKQFCRDCAGGKLWDDMVVKLKKSRSKIKTITLAMFYSEEMKENTAEYLYLKTHYPDVITFLKRCKQNESEELPRSLQRVEGYIMYNKICSRILRESANNKNVFPLTCIHDSIFYPVVAGRKEYIKNVIIEEFIKLGVDKEPTVEHGFD